MDIRDEAIKVLEMNRRTTHGYQYTVPSVEHYPYQWLWDSCFHAIILAQFDPSAARAEIRSLLSKQFPSGLVPHIIYWQPGTLHQYRWGVEGTSSLTQPPMLAYAVWEIHRRNPDRAFLESVYPSLLQYYKFLVEQRDPRHHHLIGIINPDESGEDDSPRFDSPLNAPLNITFDDHRALRMKLVEANIACNFDAAVCMRNYFWVKDVPFNAILVENLHALGHMASLLKDAEGEQFSQNNADLISKAMRSMLFRDGVYWSSTGSDYQPLRVATWAHFAPLFAGLYTSSEAETLVRTHLLDTESFYSPFGVRTVSKKEPSYLAQGFGENFSWRGPVWMSVHWFVYRGLMRYGYVNEAYDIRDKSRSLLEKSGFRECFNPETGEGLGARGFTWGALLLDMNVNASA